MHCFDSNSCGCCQPTEPLSRNQRLIQKIIDDGKLRFVFVADEIGTYLEMNAMILEEDDKITIILQE